MVAQAGGAGVGVEAVDDGPGIGEPVRVHDSLAERRTGAGAHFLQQVKEHGADVGAGGAGDAVFVLAMVVERGLEAKDGHILRLWRDGI